MACKRHKIIIHQGDAHTFTFRSYNKDTGDSYDYSSDSGTARFIQGSNTVFSPNLDLTFTDASSDNIAFALDEVETAALAVGEYDLILRIAQPGNTVYLPSENKGALIVEIKSPK